MLLSCITPLCSAELGQYQQVYRASIETMVRHTNNQTLRGQNLPHAALEQKISQQIEQLVDCHMQSFKLQDSTIQRSSYAIVAKGGNYQQVRQAIDRQLLQANRNQNPDIVGKYQMAQLRQQRCLIGAL